MGQSDQYRGSRKHILDWVSSEPRSFVAGLNDLLGGTAAVSVEADRWMPEGNGNDREARLDLLDEAYVPDGVRKALTDWWLVHKGGANTPNWDLLSTATIAGRRGLVLVEAKANCAELKVDGKVLADDASVHSRENHDRIRAAIEEARNGLNAIVPGVRIDIGTHYQLSNRLAFAWKLASLGVPNVLVYLGFTGDLGIVDAGEPLQSEEHWSEVFMRHPSPVLPPEIFNRPHLCDKSSMQIIIRARPVLSHSTLGNPATPQSTKPKMT